MELANTVGNMKIQLIFLSFLVLGLIQWLPVDGQRKTGSVSFSFMTINNRIEFYIFLSLLCGCMNLK